MYNNIKLKLYFTLLLLYGSGMLFATVGPGAPPTPPTGGGGGVAGPGEKPKNPIDMYEWYLLAFTILIFVGYYIYISKYKKSKSLT
ncbi:hypothetical protein [Riemerella columbina]|uniref:hypothetical protein n=1 Tax=Riemerella columbina TaxID=103810 RepID=UPI0003A76274|nr:hypothetical protein [Riemerella columbina]